MPKAVLYVSLLIGSILTLAVCWVYVIHQVTSPGGIALAVFGLILIGISVWKNIDVTVGDKGIQAKLQQFDRQVESLGQSVQDTKEKADLTAEELRELSHAFLTMRVQGCLRAEGFYSGVVDGWMGPRTVAAVREYQAANNIKVTGELDEPTKAAMKLTGS